MEPTPAGEPGRGPFDDPPVAPEPLRGLDALTCDAVADAAFAEPAAQMAVVVALVSVELAEAVADAYARLVAEGGSPHSRGPEPGGQAARAAQSCARSSSHGRRERSPRPPPRTRRARRRRAEELEDPLQPQQRRQAHRRVPSSMPGQPTPGGELPACPSFCKGVFEMRIGFIGAGSVTRVMGGICSMRATRSPSAIQGDPRLSPSSSRSSGGAPPRKPRRRSWKATS